MTASVRTGLAALACVVSSACGANEGVISGGGDDCASRYELVASAPTWADLRAAMLRSKEWGHVSSLRTQAQGEDIGVGSQEALRVVDLLTQNGRRLVQVEVWRTNAGAWRAGVWEQCIG